MSNKSQLYRYKLPAGLYASEKQLKMRQQQLLRKEYDEKIKPIKPHHTNHRRSQGNLLLIYEENPELRIKSDLEKRKSLAQGLQAQIKEKQKAKLMQLYEKIREDKIVNHKFSEIVKNQAQAKRKYDEKFREQLVANNQNKIKQGYSHKSQQHSPKSKQSLFQLSPPYGVESTNKKMKNSPYFEQIDKFQKKNINMFSQNIQSQSQKKDGLINDMITKRIEENMKKDNQIVSRQEKQRKVHRQELKRVLEEQIAESQRRKRELSQYYKAKFYNDDYKDVYDPICNPVDSAFSKDNKYVLSILRGEQNKSMLEKEQKISPLARHGGSSLL